jgi:acyl-CoA thioester hydrolase
MQVTNHPAPTSGRASFTWPVRVYFEDTDAGGVVYYANYLKFFERARTEWLRTTGLAQNRLATEQNILFVVRAVEASYLRPAVLDDTLDVVTTLDKLGRASLDFAQQVRRDGQTLFEARIGIACVDRNSMRPTPIPSAVRAQLASLV